VHGSATGIAPVQHKGQGQGAKAAVQLLMSVVAQLPTQLQCRQRVHHSGHCKVMQRPDVESHCCMWVGCKGVVYRTASLGVHHMRPNRHLCCA
jgi:hypothetical protein